jgi:predicted dehydrogenase
MRIVVVGLGKRAVKVLNYFTDAMEEARIVAYVDPNPQILDQLRAADDPMAFDTVDGMLDGVRPDMLFVGSPNHLHLGHIASGLRAGVRVFAEKPLVISMEQTWELAELLREYGSNRLMVGLVLRYAPQMKDLRKALAAGQVGRIVSMEANEHIEPQHGGFFMRDWRRHSKYSGGFMLEKCCHDLDLYHMITGSRPAQVASFGGRSTFVTDNAPENEADSKLYQQTASLWETSHDPFRSDGDIVDHQTAIMKFESGVAMSFHTNINTPHQSRHFCIIGTRGMAEGDLQRGYLRVTNAESSEPLFERDYTTDPDALIDHYGSDKQMAAEIAEFLRGQRASLPVSAIDAIEAGISVMAIDEARLTGNVVDLTPIWARLDGYGLRSTGRLSHAI